MINEAKVIAKNILNKLNWNQVDFAIILGSGLSGGKPDMTDEVEVSYTEVGLPAAAIKGHNRTFKFGKINGTNVVVATRIHYYEKGNMNEVRLPFEVLCCMGVKTVVLATATGGVSEQASAGTLFVINDHINMTGLNPLVGIENQWFVDMTNAYDKQLIAKAHNVAKANDFELKNGVHMQTSGPSYETAAEVRMAQILNVDTVSMSTVFDVLICCHYKMKVLALASVCNKAAGLANEEITHDAVVHAGEQNSAKIKSLLDNILK